MAKYYQVHFHIQSGYDPIVEAESEEEAIAEAEARFSETSDDDYDFYDAVCEGVVRSWEDGEERPPETPRDPCGWADFPIEEEKLEQALKACEEKSFIALIVNEILSDGDDESEKLLRLYRNATKEERMLIDAFCVYLCGWSVPTLVSTFLDELEDEEEPAEESFRGRITLGESCDFTDPCYDKDVWCRTTVTDMLPGVYNCYAVYNTDNRVIESWIIHEQYDVDSDDLIAATEVLPACGVDAGLFGYFADKPNFSSEEWDKMHFEDINFLNGSEGFFTESGYGDGAFCPVLWKNADGKVIGAATSFAE